MKREYISILMEIFNLRAIDERAIILSNSFVFSASFLRVDGWFPNCISGLREPPQSQLTFPNHLGFLSF